MAERPWPAGEDPLRVRALTVRRYRDGVARDLADEVAAEEPFELRVAGRSVAMIMRTPGDDRFLATGFLLSEGVIHAADDVVSWQPALDRDGFPQANVLDFRLRPELEASDLLGRRNFSVSSSCGLCGVASIEAARLLAPPVRSEGSVAGQMLLDLEPKLRAAQAVFRRTGGLHAAGLFDRQGRLLAFHEDVGRHNAVDKIFGQMLLAGRLPLSDTILLVSGRASFELLQKSATAGVPIFVAVGAPSSLAVELARATDVTLVGLLRASSFVIYSRPERVWFARPFGSGVE
ncbi:MAG: formate dehydrogenase accessory sulfurtransferase FdhD [Chloroflexota bacterium]